MPSRAALVHYYCARTRYLRSAKFNLSTSLGCPGCTVVLLRMKDCREIPQAGMEDTQSKGSISSRSDALDKAGRLDRLGRHLGHLASLPGFPNPPSPPPACLAFSLPHTLRTEYLL